jgi:hypothetical protein
MACWNLDLPELTSYDDPITKAYADQVGAVDSLVPGGGIAWVTKKSIARHRMIYCKSTQGDCGQGQSIPDLTLSQDTAIASKVAGAGLGIASTLGVGITSLLPGLAGAGVTLGLSLIPGVIIGIFSHHAAAVAQEENVLCLVSTTYNSYAEALERAVSSGQITVVQAQQTSATVAQQLIQQMATGYKNYNAYAYYTYALKGVELFAREQIYPKLAQPATQQILGEITKPVNIGLILGGIAAAKILFLK